MGTSSFVTVTNLAPHSCGYGESLPGKLFLIASRFDAMCKNQVRKLLVSLG